MITFANAYILFMYINTCTKYVQVGFLSVKVRENSNTSKFVVNTTLFVSLHQKSD